jgi:oxygen-independent coproporphyrinogen-3 oxidase
MDLFKKYNVAIPRYTSYPPANFFHADFEYAQCEQQLQLSNNEKKRNLSFYIHIPFCDKLCYYCGCNTLISNNKEKISSYVESLKKEIYLMKKFLDKDRKISQIHWGGGTPNYLAINQVQEIMQLFSQEFEWIEKAEIAMECHPAHLTYEYVDELIESKFNRISLGIQDFDPKVLEAVHRSDSKIPVPELVKYIKSKGNISVNLDFIYGLPFQEEENFAQTIQKAIEISPDRLVTFSYAHVPWVKKTQEKLEKFILPDVNKKTKLFEIAHKLLTQNGYISIGLDHFAKNDDELNIALENKTLHRNFQGYSTLETTGQVYALGVSGISQLSNAYFQSTKNIEKYQKSIENGKLPIEKVYFLNEEEKIIREIIDELMCNLYLNWEKIAKNHSTTIEKIKEIVEYSAEALKLFEAEKLLIFDENTIEIKPLGQYFIRNIVATFDPKLKNTDKRFSKAL